MKNEMLRSKGKFKKLFKKLTEILLFYLVGTAGKVSSNNFKALGYPKFSWMTNLIWAVRIIKHIINFYLRSYFQMFLIDDVDIAVRFIFY